MSFPRVSSMGGVLRRPLFAWCILPLLCLLGPVTGVFAASGDAGAPVLFRPTNAQRSDLRFAAVQSILFSPKDLAEATLAYNEDAQTPVFSPFSGRVIKIFAQPGDRVKAGEPLMAVAATEVAQAQSDLLSARDALDTARSQLKLAIANEMRQQGLYQAKTGALKDWLQSQADRTTAQNAERTAESALIAVRNRLRVLGQSNAEITALIHGAGKHPEMPESLVRAPISGTVIQRQVGVGQIIMSAATGATTPLFTVEGGTSLWVIAQVREVDVPNIHVGQQITVRLLAFPGRVFHAKLVWIASALDASTHRLPVRAEIANPDGMLKAGMFASMSIETASPQPTLFVPQAAVIQEENRTVVCVERPDGAVETRTVTLGDATTDPGLVEVTHGLIVGQHVVTHGAIFIEQAISTVNDPS